MPSLSFEEARDVLKEKNEEFARIHEKHRKMDEEVELLEEQRYLTPEEEVREKKLKRDKLRLKDQMAEMIKMYQANQN